MKRFISISLLAAIVACGSEDPQNQDQGPTDPAPKESPKEDPSGPTLTLDPVFHGSDAAQTDSSSVGDGSDAGTPSSDASSPEDGGETSIDATPPEQTDDSGTP